MHLSAALALALAAAVSLACHGSDHARVHGGAAVTDGCILFSPLLSTTTYLVDRAGRVRHTWESQFAPGASVHLLDDGRLLRCSREPDAPRFRGGGLGGRLQEFDWDGRLTWEWVIASEERLQHHDAAPLPNGNILVLAWEARSRDAAIRAGRDPRRVGPDGLWPECLLEVRPVRPRGGVVVWEWHLWDHLVQERDARAPDFGRVAEHPERVDVNGDMAPQSLTTAVLDRLKSLGYVGSGVTPSDLEPDFVHANAVAYNARLDQVALTVHRYQEVWVIDHATTPAEAAGHTGGRRGRGGDLLYRWGNPASYNRGASGSQQLHGPHDGRWIPDGYPGGGHLLIFDNGLGGRARASSVLEVDPPSTDGDYGSPGGRAAFGPAAPVWRYPPPGATRFYAEYISGAQRLADGNTFITDGPAGRFFEVTPGGATVWEYRNPHGGSAPNPAGDPPRSVFRATFVPRDHPGLAKLASRPAVGPRRLHPRD